MIDKKDKGRIVRQLHKNYIGGGTGGASEAQREHFISELKKYQERKNARIKR